MPPTPPVQTRERFIEELFALQKKDNFSNGKEAQKKLITGINKVVDAIKSSYGPSGSNVIVEDVLIPYHRITNDGKTIAEAIKLADPIENIGANICKEVANKSDKESGDGRKTSMILLQAILKEGAKCNDAPMITKRALDDALSQVLENIDFLTAPATIQDIGKIATVASESETLGLLFQEMYEKIGEDGIIELDNSGLSDTFYELKEGVRLLNCGYMYPYMANEDKGRKAVFNAPYVLITKQKIANLSELDAILKKVYDKGKSELVIFCDEIDVAVSQALAFLHQGISPDGQSKTQFKVLVIKAPVLWKDWLFEDFAKITKASIIDPTQGRTLKNFQISWLGYADKIIASKTESVVIHSPDLNNEIAAYIEKLKEENTDDSKLRVSRLSTKTAILKLGAPSESELSYLKGKALDARNSTHLAFKGGIVMGGGVTLNKIADMLHIKSSGDQILSKALKAPFNQITQNLDLKAEVVEDNIMSHFVYDSAIVVKNALINALSVASTILTTEIVITK